MWGFLETNMTKIRAATESIKAIGRKPDYTITGWVDARPCSHCGNKVRNVWPGGQGTCVVDHKPDCVWLKTQAGKISVEQQTP